MSKQIFEIRAYAYETKKDMEKEINLLQNSEWKTINTYELNGKWIAEYKKEISK